MNSNKSVVVQNLAKKYCKNFRRSLSYGLSDSFRAIFGSPLQEGLRPHEFWAIRDVSFELQRGDSLGVLGRNGSGKTTVLKMLTGLINPNIGTVQIKGRVEKIIALNAGFKPEMTGIENIRLRAKLLGWSGPIEKKIRDVSEFSGLGDFLEMPVMNYSSGMLARLGFSISTSFDPDILIIDEVLAVGDLDFRLRCYDRIDSIRKNATVIFVSHSLNHISRICNKSCFLQSGKMVYFGDTQEAIRLYQDESINNSKRSPKPSLKPELVEILWVQTKSNNIEFEYNEQSAIEIRTKQLPSPCWARILVDDSNDQLILDINSQRRSLILQPNSRYRVTLPRWQLARGKYNLYLQLQDKSGVQECISDRLYFTQRGTYYSSVVNQPLADWLRLE